MTRSAKLGYALGATLLVLGLGVLFRQAARGPGKRLGVGWIGVVSSSNVSLVTIGLTNLSDTTVVYTLGQVQTAANGGWAPSNAFPFGSPGPLLSLGAGSATSVVVSGPLAAGASRVPVLWGFTYLPAPTVWGQVIEDAKAWLRMRDFRGHGALYTNYAVGLRP